MAVSPAGITNTVKPKLLKKVFNQAIEQEAIKKNFPEAVAMDTVEVLDKRGRKIRISTLRDKDNNLLHRVFQFANLPCMIKRFYTTGESRIFNQKNSLPYKEVKTEVINLKKKNVVKTREEVFTVTQNQDQSNVVTKSFVEKQKTNPDAPYIETTSINQYQNKTPKNYYQTTIQRDKDGTITEKSVTHSADDLPEDVYNNNYLHTMLWKPNEFKINLFKDAVQRNGLKDENIQLRAARLGYKRGEPTQFAFYQDSERKLIFNSDYPGSDYKPFFTNITEHELTHARQYKDIRLYEKGMLSGEKAEKAKQYKENFDNYTDFKDNEAVYEKQIVEAEALENGYRSGDTVSYIFHKLLEKFNGKLVDKQMPGFVVKFIVN